MTHVLTGIFERGGKEEIMSACSFLLLLSISSLCLNANPGIKVKITEEGLHFGMQVGLEFLKQRLKEAIFEDWHGEDTSGLSGFNYTVSKIRIQHVQFPGKSLFLIPATGMKLLVHDASAIATADWRFSTWLLRSSGKLKVCLTGVSISAAAKVSKDEDGHPKLLLENCHGNVDGIDIQLDDTSRWFYRLLVNLLERPLRNNFNLNLCPIIYSEIERFNAELKQHQNRIQLDAFAVIDYSLVKPPSISLASISVDFKGAVYSALNRTQLSFEPDPFHLPNTRDFMLYIGISEYFFRSASLAYYTSGAFDVSIEKELSAYFRLTTETFNNIIPTIAFYYGVSNPVMMNLTVTAAPVISLHNGRFLLDLSGSMDVLVVQTNFTTNSMFTLNITAKTHINMIIFEKNLIPTLCLDSFDLALAHSTIGFFKASIMKNFMSYILQKGVIPAVNVNLKDGIPLPVLDTMVLVQPTITMYQGYLLISTDAKLKPTNIWKHNHIRTF
uniref:Bactericidal permeability-increasing protein n=1 Tax=Anolis carolinensis TaxID=28377 RepID=A0A803TV94_ANOCA